MSISATHKDEMFNLTKIMFQKLSNEQRLKIMNEYCKDCGCDDPRCQCSNDE